MTLAAVFRLLCPFNSIFIFTFVPKIQYFRPETRPIRVFRAQITQTMKDTTNNPDTATAQEISTNGNRPDNSQKVEAAEVIPTTDFKREVMHRLQLSGRKDKRRLKEIANQVGGEIVQYIDEYTGRSFFCSRDEFILRRFLTSTMKSPTPARLLAWQKIKGEDISQYGGQQVTEDSTRSVSELRKELRQIMGVIGYAQTGKTTAAAEIVREADNEQGIEQEQDNAPTLTSTGRRRKHPDKYREFPIVPSSDGGQAIIIDEDADTTRLNRPRLSWQQ